MKVGFYGYVLKSMLSFEDLRIQSSDFTLLALTKITNRFNKVLIKKKKNNFLNYHMIRENLKLGIQVIMLVLGR